MTQLRQSLRRHYLAWGVDALQLLLLTLALILILASRS